MAKVEDLLNPSHTSMGGLLGLHNDSDMTCLSSHITQAAPCP